MTFFPLRSPVPAKEKKEMGAITSASEELSRVTWLQLVIYIEFLASVTICIFTMIGVSIGWPVSCVFLLSLLQFGITVPGCIFSTQRAGIFLLVYIALQGATGLCEIIWLVAHLVKGGVWYHAAGLGFLTALQLVSILVALCCRDRAVVRRPKKDLETHLFHGSPASTIRDVEKGSTVSKTDEKSSHRPVENKMKKRPKKRSRKSSKKRSVSEEDSIRTRSTQPTNTKITPTRRAVPTMHTGQTKMDQIKKMIAEMNEKSQRYKQKKKKKKSSEITKSRSKELVIEMDEKNPGGLEKDRKTASRSERW